METGEEEEKKGDGMGKGMGNMTTAGMKFRGHGRDVPR